jgi:hypothetical protein
VETSLLTFRGSNALRRFFTNQFVENESEKAKTKEKRRKIEEMRREIEIAKNPQTLASKARTNHSENDIEKNFNLNLNSGGQNGR